MMLPHGCVTLGKLLALSEPQLPYLKRGGNHCCPQLAAVHTETPQSHLSMVPRPEPAPSAEKPPPHPLPLPEMGDTAESHEAP